MIIDEERPFRLLYVGGGKYKISEFLPAICEWFEFSGEATKQEATREYLYLIHERCSYDRYLTAKNRLFFKI